MATLSKIRGYSQIMDKSIRLAQLADDLGLKLSQLEEGAELLKRDGSVAMTGDLNLNGKKVTNVANGTTSTDAINLGQLQAAINAIPNPMEYKGLFDASEGSMPETGDNGDMYVVSVTGVVDGQEYLKGTAIVFKPVAAKSGGTVPADWDILDRQDQVLTVAGKMGNVTLVLADLTDITVTAAEVNQLAGVKGNVQAALDSKLDDTQLVDDGTFATPTADTIASTKAVKTYVDAGVAAAKTYADTKDTELKTYVNNQILAKIPAFVDGEIPAGLVDGTNRTFTLANTPVAGSVKLYQNGQRLNAGANNDFVVTDKQIVINAERNVDIGDILLVDYRTN